LNHTLQLLSDVGTIETNGTYLAQPFVHKRS
jgi:hypothetical protein